MSLGIAVCLTATIAITTESLCCTAVRACGVRGAALIAGAINSAPGKPTSLVTFLFGNKKVTRPLTAVGFSQNLRALKIDVQGQHFPICLGDGGKLLAELLFQSLVAGNAQQGRACAGKAECRPGGAYQRFDGFMLLGDMAEDTGN